MFIFVMCFHFSPPHSSLQKDIIMQGPNIKLCIPFACSKTWTRSLNWGGSNFFQTLKLGLGILVGHSCVGVRASRWEPWTCSTFTHGIESGETWPMCKKEKRRMGEERLELGGTWLVCREERRQMGEERLELGGTQLARREERRRMREERPKRWRATRLWESNPPAERKWKWEVVGGF
jgi:hypothetical protein